MAAWCSGGLGYCWLELSLQPTRILSTIYMPSTIGNKSLKTLITDPVWLITTIWVLRNTTHHQHLPSNFILRTLYNYQPHRLCAISGDIIHLLVSLCLSLLFCLNHLTFNVYYWYEYPSWLWLDSDCRSMSKVKVKRWWMLFPHIWGHQSSRSSSRSKFEVKVKCLAYSDW